MAAEMIEKPLTEAQQIVARLRSNLGMSYAAIAKETQITRQTVRDIDRGRNAGHLHVHRLRKFMEMWESQGLHGDNADNAASSLKSSLSSLPAVGAIASGEVEPATIALNADEPTPAEPKTLKDKASDWLRAAMLGEPVQPPGPSMSSPSRRKNEKGDGPKEDFVAKITPIGALLFVIYIRSRIHDPYKPVAPQQNEMSDILEPWMTWIAKQLDIRGKLTEDANIVLASLVATGLYGVRAYETYQAIHAEEVQRARSDNRTPADAASFIAASGGGPNNAAAAPADAGAGRGVRDASVPLPFWRGDAGLTRQAARPAGREPRGEPASPEQRRADASIEQLLAADHAGRQRLGL